jgi:dipeptidyl aminopeptidase/acylaminoacyl peptidase
MSSVRSRFTASAAVLALLVAAVVSSSVVGAPSAGAFTMPSFYDLPNPLPPGGPGTVIKTEPVTVGGLHGTMKRVMYKSKSIRGDDIAVTGLIATPDTPPPAGGYKVLSWAHGTTGMADQCAPSLDAADALPAVNAFLDKGWVVVGTDYEGLGTPGLHPYIVGDSEARGVIDIVRAARNLSSEVSADYAVWGHSQGGHASMFTAHIAHTWAPELHLVGAVAGAPPSQLNLVYDFL